MSNADDLRAVHLARLPTVMLNGSPVTPWILRAVMLAIIVDTDNGRHPALHAELAKVVGIKSGSSYFRSVVARMIIAGLLDVGPLRQSYIGSSTTRSLRVNVERLRELARPPLCRDGSIRDPEGVALLPAPPGLFAVRAGVLNRQGVGVAFIGKISAGEGNQAERMRLRASVLREVRDLWKRESGFTLTDYHLGQLVGLSNQCVRDAFKRYPAAAAGPDVPMYGTSIPGRRAAARSTP